MGPLSGANECFLMVVTEYLTKWAEMYSIPNKQATTVFKCLKKVIGRNCICAVTNMHITC